MQKKVRISCKYGCGYDGDVIPYVGFFPQERITEAHKRDPYLPKYGVHLGVDCPNCGRHQKWLSQDDDIMLADKFYLSENKKQSEWSSYEASSANILEVRVKTNCPMGGDGGHGGVTVFEMKDLGGTCVEYSPIQGGIRIELRGDTECATFTECLDFAASELRRKMRENRGE